MHVDQRGKVALPLNFGVMRVGDCLVCIQLAGEGRFDIFSNSARFLFSRKQINTFAASTTTTVAAHAPPPSQSNVSNPPSLAKALSSHQCARNGGQALESPLSPPPLSPGGTYPQPAADAGGGAAPHAH